MELINSTRKRDLPSTAVETLDNIGFNIGRRLAEKTAQDRNRFNPANSLDIIKFLCKDFWTETFGKQVDNLRTNHRGTYVLIDNKFRWLTRMSLVGQNEDLRRIFTALPCALLRGALTALGMHCVVTADASQSPAVTFTLTVE